MLTFLSVLSLSSRSGGSGHTCCGQCCQEPGGHMKINLPIFKDEDKKDTITYQSWCWDIMVYHQAGCQDCTLLPFIMHYLQGYPGELVRSLGTDITLDGILAILDKHYNNVKALDTLNQEFFQLWMGKRRRWCQNGGYICWGISKFSQLCTQNAFCWITLPNWSMTTSTMGCLNGWKRWWHTSRQPLMRRCIQITFGQCGKLRRKRQWKHPIAQTAEPVQASLGWWASSLYRKLKGTQPSHRLPAVRGSRPGGGEHQAVMRRKVLRSEDPNGIKGVTEEFIVHLARGVKDAQAGRRNAWYHCEQPREPLTRDCPLLVKASRSGLNI